MISMITMCLIFPPRSPVTITTHPQQQINSSSHNNNRCCAEYLHYQHRTQISHDHTSQQDICKSSKQVTSNNSSSSIRPRATPTQVRRIFNFLLKTCFLILLFL